MGDFFVYLFIKLFAIDTSFVSKFNVNPEFNLLTKIPSLIFLK